MNLAPIVLFVYNRPHHTKQTVEALQKNEFAKESELFIFSDAAKNEEVLEKVNEVRAYIKTIDGFKKVNIIEREKNWGLADSIIDGVTKIINEYGKVIVLEDDLVTSPYFLKFMNEALEFYKNEKKVWHISGWNYPIKTDGLEDVFFWRLMNCWGWATWADRWQYYKKDIEKTINTFSQKDINRFNIDGAEDFWSQVISNKEGKINTWAIFWYATIFKQNGLCLNPTQTFVENIGHDASGMHCSKNSFFSSTLNYKDIMNFNNSIRENKKALEYVKNFYKMNKKSFISKITDKFKRLLK